MDDNLEESLNLDESIGVDFEVEGNTIIVADTNTDLTTSQEDVPMEFDTIQEPVIMETEGEEITVSEFMGEQFVLNSEYEVHDEGNASLSLESGIDGNTIVESVASSSNPNSLLKDNAVDFHFEEEPLVETMVTSLQQPSTITTSNAAQPTVFRIQRPREKATIPRPVPIAPKPQNRPAANYSIVKPVPIAPKQTATAAKTVPGFTKIQFISQVGKQVIMLPASNKRFKMVHSAGGIQYINDKESKEATTTPTTAKPLKFIVKGTKPELVQQQPKLVTKVVNTKLPEARFVCVNKNVPVSTKMITIPIQIKSKSVLSTNSSQKFVQVTPSNVVSLKSPTKVIPATTMSTTVQNKAVILPKASPVRNVILKTVRKKPQQMQYFRLATEQPAESSETENKTIMVTYNKEKLATSSAPPPLVVTSGKVNRKFKKSTITIPAAGKEIVTRSPQSLLAPIVPTPPEPVQSQAAPPDLEDKKDPELSQQDILIDSKEEVKKSLLKDNMDVRKVSSQPSELSWSIEEEQLDDSYRVCVIDPDSYSKNQSFSEPECNPNISSNDPPTPTDAVLNSRPRKACNCNKSQCLKLYCECFANGEFCKDCNCVNCHNNLVNDDARRAAIMGCLERNPDAFRPKIGKARSTEGPATVRRHNKGCNCKRSGCLKNYCECYEAKIACTPICKCVGCRNVEDGGERNRKTCVARVPRIIPRKEKQPCRLLTTSVIEAAVQCLLAAAVPPDGVPVGAGGAGGAPPHDAVRAVLTEYARCLHAVMSAARHAQAIT